MCIRTNVPRSDLWSPFRAPLLIPGEEHIKSYLLLPQVVQFALPTLQQGSRLTRTFPQRQIAGPDAKAMKHLPLRTHWPRLADHQSPPKNKKTPGGDPDCALHSLKKLLMFPLNDLCRPRGAFFVVPSSYWVSPAATSRYVSGVSDGGVCLAPQRTLDDEKHTTHRAERCALDHEKTQAACWLVLRPPLSSSPLSSASACIAPTCHALGKRTQHLENAQRPANARQCLCFRTTTHNENTTTQQ